MISNSVTPNRRLILSAKNLYFYQQKRKENLENSSKMKNEYIDNDVSINENDVSINENDVSINEDNGSYILGYN